MAKRMMADVLWDAANEHLDCGEPYSLNGEHSCCAAAAAADDWAPSEDVIGFLRALGAPRHGYSWIAFRPPQRQGVRYMWLLLAMHVAEDEGLTC